ncbi:non-ribosomal peptide synthetase [Shouchella lonarensis]|uniref:Amino acid adenylation domain-containing protein n=1 Tax=Shouchella lonarensis TaxID=1464122 RepID=A0A1G6HCM5_9BACI|nr:non-ribosomal peptide synthetase [Shouchella lonarensis]SDB92010.1 amino acid adenylation domain-containing protein [Shouchella lonarensis]
MKMNNIVDNRHAPSDLLGQRMQQERTYAQLGRDQEYFTGITAIPFVAQDDIKEGYGHHSFTIPSALTAALGRFTKQENVTLYTALLAAFYTLLYRYTSHEDIAIATPAMDQPGANIRIIRASVKGDRRFLDLLHGLVAADAYQEMPVEADAASSYQVFFALQNGVAGVARSTDLSLTFQEEGTHFVGRLAYNKRLFTAEAITRMEQHFLTLLRAIVDEPTKPIAALPLLTDAERHHLLVEKNETNQAFRFDMTLPELFSAQVKKTPKEVAVTFGDTCLSYEALDARITQLAAYLRATEVKRGTVVGLLLPRSIHMVVALLGVSKAGGTYVPIDPDHPTERISYVLRDSGVTFVLSTSQMDVPLVDGLKRINVDELSCHAAGHEETWTYTHDENDNAYIIYTSGSTGQPKGVMISHRAVTNFVYGITDFLPFQPGERIASVATMSFDLSLLETIVPLTVGMQVAIADTIEQTNPAHFHQFISRNEIDWLQFTPSRLQMMWGDGSAFSRLKGMLVGAEPLSQALLDKVNQSFTGDIYHLYGPTEATIWSSGKLLDPTAPIDLGQPFANTEIYVLDASLSPVPTGFAGELYIGGLGLAQGYVNKPALTEQAFIPHPFKQGRRLYKTGDVARYLEDGTLQFLGRKDAQVKIRGFRIELYEVEHVLRAHSAVQSAAVVAREDATFEKQLVGYIVPTPGTDVSIQEVRTFMQKKLPTYMIPTLWVKLEEMPLTPNGKVDRKALPAPNMDGAHGEKPSQAPSTPVETFLSQALATLLASSHIGLHDKFLDIGGHSLKMTQLSSRIEKQYNISVTLQDIFAHPSVYELARFITEKQAAHVDTATDEHTTDLVDTMSEEEIEAMLNMLLEEGARHE